MERRQTMHHLLTTNYAGIECRSPASRFRLRETTKLFVMPRKIPRRTGVWQSYFWVRSNGFCDVSGYVGFATELSYYRERSDESLHGDPVLSPLDHESTARTCPAVDGRVAAAGGEWNAGGPNVPGNVQVIAEIATNRSPPRNSHPASCPGQTASRIQRRTRCPMRLEKAVLAGFSPTILFAHHTILRPGCGEK